MKLTTEHMPAGQQKILFETKPDGEELARPIVTFFESQAQAGTRFRDGQTVELGWSLLLLRQIGENLEVFEPDFDCFPIRWSEGINNTLRHLSLQRAICDSFACEPQFPTIRQAGIVSPQFFQSRNNIMSRETPTDSDSGWVFTECGYSGSEGEFSSLYQLALQKVEIIPFLALPALSRIVIKPGFREVTINTTTKSSDDHELLRALATSTVLV